MPDTDKIDPNTGKDEEDRDGGYWRDTSQYKDGYQTDYDPYNYTYTDDSGSHEIFKKWTVAGDKTTTKLILNDQEQEITVWDLQIADFSLTYFYNNLEFKEELKDFITRIDAKNGVSLLQKLDDRLYYKDNDDLIWVSTQKAEISAVKVNNVDLGTTSTIIGFEFPLLFVSFFILVLFQRRKMMKS